MTSSNFSKKQFPSKAKAKEQIADEMGMHIKTMQRRLKKAKLFVPPGLVSPQKQVEIFERLGWLS